MASDMEIAFFTITNIRKSGMEMLHNFGFDLYYSDWLMQ